LLYSILGITQGFIPIAGYNHGAQNYERVKESIQISIKYAALLASLILFLYFTTTPIVSVFTTDPKVIDTGCLALVFAASPIIAIQLIELLFSGGGKC
jgi:Na+-driven multidrug efflux pump